MALIFLKLGGSLITEKTRPYTPRIEKINELACQIASAVRKDAHLQLVLGHGSGSFGHQAADQFDTQRGVSGQSAWHGFAEVWYQASKLNRIVIEALHQAGLPVITFSPAASVSAHDGKVSTWDTHPIQMALESNLLPVIHGDVAFDDARGGTILSTEALFVHLARDLHPERILLAGMEEGVWADFPQRQNLIKAMSPDELSDRAAGLGKAAGTDVTGGMRSKVMEMLALVEELPGLEVLIFSGEVPERLGRALAGGNPGTRLHR